MYPFALDPRKLIVDYVLVPDLGENAAFNL